MGGGDINLDYSKVLSGATTEKIATRKSFGEALVKLGAKYKNVVVLDADLSSSVQTGAFAKEFPNRHFNMGIAEQNMVATAAGFATRGKLPFACSFSVFATGRAWEIVRNAVCYPNLNVKIVGSHAGIMTGEDGASHQALEDLAIMRVLPNMKVVCPADHYEALSVMETLMNDYGPTYLRINRQATEVIYTVSGNGSAEFKFGKADVLFGAEFLKDGDEADVCIFAIGSLVSSSLKAAQKLKEEGKKVMVVNMSSLKPMDEKTVLECAANAKICVTAEDHSILGGLGGAVAEILAENGIGVKLVRIGMHDKFGESGKSGDLYKKYGFDTDGVYKTLRDLV